MEDKQKDLFTAGRWTEIPRGRITGHREFTEEEKRINDQRAEDCLKKYGILKEKDHIQNGVVVSND